MLIFLKLLFAFLTALFGILTLFRPKSMAAEAGLNAESPSGMAEIRASWGGLFIGLGLAALLFRSHEVYYTLAIAYACVVIVRLVSILLDRRIANQTLAGIIGFEFISVIIFLI